MARRALKRLVLVLCLLSGRSLAAAPPLLVVHVRSCDASRLDEAAALHALRAELEADGVRNVVEGARADSAAPVLTVTLACDAGLTVTVELRSVAGAERRQSFALVDTLPETRPRAFALAVAEVVRLQWQELEQLEVGPGSAPAAAVMPPAAPAEQPHESAFDDAPESPSATSNTSPTAALAAEATAQPRAPIVPVSARPALAAPGADTPPSSGDAAPRAWAFRAGARARWFTDYQSASFGGHVGVDRSAFRAELETLLSAPSDVLGQASLGIAAASVGYRVFDVPVGPLQLAGYPAASAGATWARATPRGPGVVAQPTAAFYGDLRLVVDARVRAPSLTPTLALEVGRATGLAVHAADRTLGATGGFFLGASAGAQY